MGMPASEIEALIKAALPDAQVTMTDLAGDNDHWAAHVVSAAFAGKPRIAETRGAIPIDGLSHEEIADIFNRCSVFYSYDEATFYSQYAAICGCLSVVVPGLYSSREEWVASHPIARYGVAYGLDDLDHARRVRPAGADLDGLRA